MKHLILLLLSGILFLQSCGEDKKPIKSDNKKLVLQDEQAKSKDLVVTINADFNTNDEIILFWKDKNIAWFDDKNTVYGGVSPEKGRKNVTFKIPSGVVPNDVRIDISSNKAQGDIAINFIKFQSEDREFYVFGDELDKYFKGNEYLTIKNGSKKIGLNSANGNYDPFLTTTHDLSLELEKVLQTAF